MNGYPGSFELTQTPAAGEEFLAIPLRDESNIFPADAKSAAR